jgi:acylphosphatase
MIARRVVISGRVQGVGFRDWLVWQARRRGVHGWVRNRRDGTVEALLHGEDAAVADLLRLCHDGPPHADVQDVAHGDADPPAETGFHRVPTA